MTSRNCCKGMYVMQAYTGCSGCLQLLRSRCTAQVGPDYSKQQTTSMTSSSGIVAAHTHYCLRPRRLEACLHQAKHAAASLQVHSSSWGAAKLDVDVYRQVRREVTRLQHTISVY
jgi:hypothetical protein